MGGVLFAVTWLLGTVLFGLYVANFASYSNTYGALGGVVILMLWFYLTAVALLVAAEVTAMLAKDREPQVIEARRRELKEGTARKAGQVAGAAVGVAKAATGADGDDDDADDGADSAAGADGRVRRDGAGSQPGRAVVREGRSARPVFSRPHQPDQRSHGRFAAVIVGAGALLGVLLGRLAGDDDRGGAASG